MGDERRTDDRHQAGRHVGPLGDLPEELLSAGDESAAVRGGGIDTSPTLGGPDTTPSATSGLYKVGDVTLKRG